MLPYQDRVIAEHAELTERIAMWTRSICQGGAVSESRPFCIGKGKHDEKNAHNRPWQR